MLIETTEYESDERYLSELRSHEALCLSISEYGLTPGLEVLLHQDLLMSTVYFENMRDTLSTEAATAAASAGAASVAAGEKSKGLVAKLLTKLSNFWTYVQNRITGFVSSVTNRVGHGSFSSTAKVTSAQAVNGAMDVLPKAATAVNGIAGVANKAASSPEVTKQASGTITNLIASVKTNAFKLIPFTSGDKVSFKTSSVESNYPKVAAKLGGWSRPTLSGLVTKFSNGAHAVWNALRGFVSAIKKLVLGALKLGGKTTKAPVALADKGAAGAIKTLTKVSLSGGLKGFAAGMASMMFITYLVNTVLKLIKAVLNFASGMVHDTVDAICGPEQ